MSKTFGWQTVKIWRQVSQLFWKQWCAYFTLYMITFRLGFPSLCKSLVTLKTSLSSPSIFLFIAFQRFSVGFKSGECTVLILWAPIHTLIDTAMWQSIGLLENPILRVKEHCQGRRKQIKICSIPAWLKPLSLDHHQSSNKFHSGCETLLH